MLLHVRFCNMHLLTLDCIFDTGIIFIVTQDKFKGLFNLEI